jgi:LPS-assembly protein
MRFTPLALAAGLFAGSGIALGGPAAPPAASAAAPPGLDKLQSSSSLQPAPRGEAARRLPSVLRARSVLSQPDFLTTADGDAEFRRGDLSISADHLAFDAVNDLATARGQVRIEHDGAIFSGPEMQLEVQRFQGYFLHPEFEFPLLGASGSAERIDFVDASRSRAIKADYTTCRRDSQVEPDWLLRADKLLIDLNADEGVAEGAVLHFLGAPILALPTLSFPLSGARRSGWLPPSVNTDNRSGVELAVPYYWNIAANRDATFTPRVITRRGFGLNTEFRYLEPRMEGAADVEWLPFDRLTGSSRSAIRWTHDGRFGPGFRVRVDAVHVSDDGWWKDFPNAARSLTPRLLPLRAALERPFTVGGDQGLIYARAEDWQVLQGSDAVVVAPYQRSPQMGIRLGGEAAGWQYLVESEFNHFTLPGGDAARAGRVGGSRFHVLGDLSWPLREASWFVVPKFSVNAATYSGAAAEGRRRGRVIPTLSLDAGFELERQTEAFGRHLRQTLEPRLLYVLTPYHRQSDLPNYDAAAKDFNFSSIYSVNQFSGVDRVSDGNALTAGFTTRFVDAASGVESLRLGLVQRYLFSTQRETPQADGSPDGPPIGKRWSDVLLVGSTSLLPRWTLDSALQYTPDQSRWERSVLGARYSPGPFRTLSLTYRFTRGLTEQAEFGWQWPVWSRQPSSIARGGPRGDSGRCGGTWYAVGRVNYSVRDRRITDSVLGAEYDAGCWITRVVAERLSTGSSESTTRLMLQLELVGLSRLGSNPLQVLKDNIPGYRLLHDVEGAGSNTDDSPTDRVP